MKITMDLEPILGVGPFKFGTVIKDYVNFPISEDPQEYDPTAKYGDWKVYKIIDQDVRIYVEPNIDSNNEKIISIACNDYCIYSNTNLIGLNIENLIELLKQEPSGVDSLDLSSGMEDVFEFDSLGLEVFTKKGIIVSIVAYCPSQND